MSKLSNKFEVMINWRIEEIGLSGRKDEATLSKHRGESQETLTKFFCEEIVDIMTRLDGFDYGLEMGEYKVVRKFNCLDKDDNWIFYAGDYHEAHFFHPFTEANLLEDLRKCLAFSESLCLDD
jgi:hypothetical protein